MYVIYLENNNQVMVNDPIGLIINQSDFFRSGTAQDPLFGMAVLRTMYGDRGRKLVYHLTNEMLSDLPPNIYSHKDLALAVSYLMLEQRLGRLDELTHPIIGGWVETLSRSFMRVDLSKSSQPSVSLNPNYIITAHYRMFRSLNLRNKNSKSLFKGKVDESILGQAEFVDLWKDLALEPDWWRRLAMLEAFRHALKSGKPLVCPFKGFQFKEFEVEALQDYPVKCGERCFIRFWINILKDKTEMVGSNSTCEA